MRPGTRSRPWIALMLAGAIASGARAQVAVAQETGSETGGTTDEKVVFTWGGTGEPSSLNPMSGYSAIDAYFWTPQYHLLIDFDVNFDAEPGLATKVETADDNMTSTYTISDQSSGPTAKCDLEHRPPMCPASGDREGRAPLAVAQQTLVRCSRSLL